MADGGLPIVPAGWLHEVACGLNITQLVGGATAPWKPNREQIAVWAAGEEHRRRYITKSRRRGVSTALDLEDAVWTKWCDELGHRVRCGVVLHREDNLRERMVQMASFLQQLYGHGDVKDIDASTFSIAFPNGSEIFGLTAGASDSSRSEGAQRMRYEEYAFYRGGIGAIAPSVSLGVTETICTTIDIGAPNGIKARDMWRSTTNAYEKIFFPFYIAREYRADPKLITDEQWEWAQCEGFPPTKVGHEAASYWLTEVLPNKCEDDLIRAFREYPPTPEHMFRASESRWVNKTPEVLKPIDRVPVLATSGEIHYLLIYRQPKDTNGDVVFGVDTAAGKDKDRCALAGVDRVDRQLVCAFVDGKIHGDDFAKVVRAGVQHYTVDVDGKTNRPDVYVEDNTTGQITIQPLAKMGVSYHAFDTTEDSKYAGLLEAKRAVEVGTLKGPPELAEECDELHRDERGKWKGRKDLLMAYGFAATRIAANPPRIGPEDRREDLHEQRIKMGRRIIRQQALRERGKWW